MPDNPLQVDRGARLAGSQPLRLRQRGRVCGSPRVHLREKCFIFLVSKTFSSLCQFHSNSIRPAPAFGKFNFKVAASNIKEGLISSMIQQQISVKKKNIFDEWTKKMMQFPTCTEDRLSWEMTWVVKLVYLLCLSNDITRQRGDYKRNGVILSGGIQAINY